MRDGLDYAAELEYVKELDRSAQMNTQLAVVDHSKDLAVTSEQVKIARATVAKGLNDDQFSVYLYNCQRQRVHPLDGLVVPIVRKEQDGGERLTFVTTVDLLRSRADETGDYAGSDDPFFTYPVENPTAADKPTSSTVTVWKFVHGEKCAFTATARYDEYYPGEKQGFMWKSKPHVMLGKCAEGLALRKAFPKQLAGLYLEEELQKENKPARTTPAKPSEKPVGNVKCSECNAIGGHLPKCSKRQGPAPQAQPAPEQASPVEQNVMCGDCGKVNGHTPECKYAKKAETNPGWTETVVVINSIEKKETRPDKNNKTKPYLILEVTDADKFEWRMYCWHQSLHQYLKPKQMMVCQYSERKDQDKTFCSLERVLELAGVTFSDNKPVVA
jgi:phage recombination protein Bet